MYNIINNSTEIFTASQLETFDALSETEQYQVESVIQCASSMLLMNLSYQSAIQLSSRYVLGVSAKFEFAVFAWIYGKQYTILECNDDPPISNDEPAY